MQWASPTGRVTNARASLVDHNGSGIIAMNESNMLDENGVIWWAHGGWDHNVNQSLPIAVSEIKYFHGSLLLTYDNVAWVYSPPEGGWVNKGPWPGSPVPVGEKSWGNIKSGYAGDKKDD